MKRIIEKFQDRYDHDRAFREQVRSSVWAIIFLLLWIMSLSVPLVIILNILEAWK